MSRLRQPMMFRPCSVVTIASLILSPPKEDEVMPAKFEDDLIWVAADTPLTDSAFLSNKIKDLCGDLPIFWLRPTYSTSKQTESLSKRYENVESKEANFFFFFLRRR